MRFKTDFLNAKKFPLTAQPAGESESQCGADSLVSICLENREFFQTELLRRGALLFRGFNIREANDFERFAESFSGRRLLDYAGGVSPRRRFKGKGVYSSTEYPPHLTLSLHNELSYSNHYPSQIYFCCQTAPEFGGGETPIGDSRRILKNIDPAVVREFKSRRIKYERNLTGEAAGSGYGWQDAFETNDKRAVEKLCREIDADFEWTPDGGLRLSQIRPATAIHPLTGEEVWFNQADGFHPSNLDAETRAAFRDEEFRLNARFGDGTPIDISMLEHIREVLRNEMTIFSWRVGDVLVLDNLLAAHGRMPFSGARKILAAMT